MKTCKNCIHKITTHKPAFSMFGAKGKKRPYLTEYFYCNKGNEYKFGITKCKEYRLNREETK